MAVVYEAVHVLSRRRVALKVLFHTVSQGDDIARQRFLREVSAPAQIGHPGIVEIYDAGFDDDGSPFVAMELLEGETLRSRLARSRLAVADALELFERVLEPLAAAHERGIVHRDLKPDNVFLAHIHGREILKILDFGIARNARTGEEGFVTGAGVALGTPHYMAPEQAMNAAGVTAAADVWSLGAMMYEAVSGKTPFHGATASAIVVQVVTEPHPPLAEVAPSVPPALAGLIDRCLSKQPEDRPPDGGRLLVEIRRLRRGAVVPPTSPMAQVSAGAVAASLEGPTERELTPAGARSTPSFGSPPSQAGRSPTRPETPHAQAPATTPSDGTGAAWQSGPGVHTQGAAWQSGPGAMSAGAWQSGPGVAAPQGKPPKKGSMLGPILALVALLVVIGGIVGVAAVVVSVGGGERPSAAGDTGTLQITTEIPGAELYVDGASFGAAITGQQHVVRAGPHQLELRQAGSVLATQSVVVPQNGVANAHFRAAATPPQPPPSRVAQTRVEHGFLGHGDATIPSGEFADTRAFDWPAQVTVKLEAKSTSFDTYLIVRTPDGQQHSNDDQPNGLRDAMLEIFTLVPGRYEVLVTSYQAGETGAYELHITE